MDGSCSADGCQNMTRTLNWHPKANGTTRLVIREEPETQPLSDADRLLYTLVPNTPRCSRCGQVLGNSHALDTVWPSSLYQAMGKEVVTRNNTLFDGIFGGRY